MSRVMSVMLYSSHVIQRHLCLSTFAPVKSSVFILILVSSFLAPPWSVTASLNNSFNPFVQNLILIYELNKYLSLWRVIESFTQPIHSKAHIRLWIKQITVFMIESLNHSLNPFVQKLIFIYELNKWLSLWRVIESFIQLIHSKAHINLWIKQISVFMIESLNLSWFGVRRLHGGARNTETRNFFGIFNKNTEMTDTGTHTHRRWNINNNPRQTWGRTDYMKGNMTGNTWDEIKTDGD